MQQWSCLEYLYILEENAPAAGAGTKEDETSKVTGREQQQREPVALRQLPAEPVSAHDAEQEPMPQV